jgi:hypothetical protein
MKQKISPLHKYLQIILTGLCIVMVYMLWLATKPMSYVNESQNAAVNEEESNAISSFPNIENTIPTVDEFEEMINRPLFYESRVPFVFEEAEEIEKSNNTKKTNKKRNEEYSLSAVIITPDKKIALIQLNREKELQRINLGENIDDWKLEEVEPHQIKLSKGAETKTLLLEIKNSSPERKQAKSNRNKKNDDVKPSPSNADKVTDIQKEPVTDIKKSDPNQPN